MLKRKTMEVFPKRIEIELASACNLRCVYCPRKYLNDLNDFIQPDLFKRIIDEASAYPGTIIVMHRRGESLLHPDFVEICDYIKDKFHEIQIATNAVLLDDNKSKALIDSVTFISFSLDVPEVFDKTRIPAKYSLVENNINRFLELNRNKVKTQVSMVRTQKTPPENPERFKKIWAGKVDRIRIYEEHSRGGRFGSLSFSRGERKTCTMPFYEILVYANGKVGRCNHDWNNDYAIGDLNDKSIKGIWNSGYYKDLRAQQRSLNITDNVCKNCDSWYPEFGMQKTGEVSER